MSKDHNFFGAKEGFLSRERPTAVLHALDDSVEISEVFPNESTNAWVIWDGFVVAFFVQVTSFRTFDWNVVDVGDSDVRDFFLEDKGDVVVKYRNGVRPSHG
jgi:hypothetical protein